MWNSSIISNDIACHTLRAISMISHLSMSRRSNLCSIGCVQMITNTELPVAIEGDCSCNRIGEAVASDSFTDISMISRYSVSSGPNFMWIGGVKMVTRGCPPVAIKRNCSCHLSSVNKTLYAFWYIAMIASLTRGCCPNFIDICGVKVVAYTWPPIAIKSRQSCINIILFMLKIL